MAPRTWKHKKEKKDVKSMVKKEVKAVLGKEIELKYYGQSFSNVPMGTIASTYFQLYPITQVAQGLTDITRVGDQVTIKNLEMIYTLTAGIAGTGFIPLDFIRVILFQWHPNDNSPGPPLANNIMQVGATTGVDVTSFYNHDGRHQYHIFYDRTHKVIASNYSSSGYVANSSYCNDSEQRISKKFYKGFNKTIQFSGAGLYATNHIYCLIYGTNPTPGLYTGTQMSFNTQMNFTDA